MNQNEPNDSAAVIAVIVTYFPTQEFLEPLLKTLISQTHKVVIVDNTPGAVNDELVDLIAQSSQPGNCVLIRFEENFGIAKAINTGCERARTLGADFVLLSDQDSLPADDMIDKLLEANSDLVKKGIRVSAVGPTYKNLVTGVTHPFQVQLPERTFYSYAAPTKESPYVEALSLITSGSLISISSLDQIGPMREDFFVDLVDIEWCHRATSKGYRCFGSGHARMSQRLGEAHFRVWYFSWRDKSLYSPLRIYYQTRNFVALWKVEFVDWRWKLSSTWFKLGIVCAHVIFSPFRLQCLRMALMGLVDGLRNKMGECQNQNSQKQQRKTCSLHAHQER